ncbi:MAG: nucleotide sugar dehydrogenase [Elusimicrobia bacterium]|nr:nucleotide sugar dehydrogenase [Candidatus Liberimonas magnetica]
MYRILSNKIKNNEAKIGIMGLGYVGLPLAVAFASEGFAVTGFEVDPAKVKAIKSKRSYIDDVDSKTVSALVTSKKLNSTTDFSHLKNMDVIIICVPTPLRKSKDPDVSYIVASAESISKIVREGQLIILESTTYPGTTKEIVQPLLEKGGLKCGKDLYLAFSPERVDPGNKTYNIRNTPKVVGGIDLTSADLAKDVYAKITMKVCVVSSTEAAEMVKLLENTFRAVNIGLVNEVALMCDRLKLDCWEIIEAAASKPFGYMPFYPGPGIGGHCIPLDPQYLSWKLKTLNFYSRFIELAGEINAKMPEYLVQKIVDSLNKKGKSINGAAILMLGMAYKKNISDIRESPALDILKLLIDKDAKIEYYDPFVPNVCVNIGSKQLKYSSIKDLKNIKKYDAVVITTNHTDVDYCQIVKNAKLIIDSRNATNGLKGNNIVRL